MSANFKFVDVPSGRVQNGLIFERSRSFWAETLALTSKSEETIKIKEAKLLLNPFIIIDSP